MADSDVEQCWQEFWEPIVAPDGNVSLEQVKKELYDFRTLMRSAAVVYEHVTGGRISNVLTLPEAVIAVSDDCASELVAEEYAELLGLLRGVLDGWTKGDDVAGPMARARARLRREERA